MDEPHPIKGSGHRFTKLQVITNETPSIFDAFPEVFTNDQDDDADNTFSDPSGSPTNTVSIYGQCPKSPNIDPDQLPYSYMVEYAGQVPKVLSTVDPAVNAWVQKIRYPLPPIRKKTNDTPAFNIAGEAALERRFRQIYNPVNYLVVVRGFRLLMAIRNMTIENKAPYVSPSYALMGTCSSSLTLLTRPYLPQSRCQDDWSLHRPPLLW